MQFFHKKILGLCLGIFALSLIIWGANYVPFSSAQEATGTSVDVARFGECGNGDVEISNYEECDDGNTDSDDGCSATCVIETGWVCSGEPSFCDGICADSLVRGTEGCDDGGTDPDDGCSAICTVEIGWSCTGEPSSCSPGCGDGLIRGSETCDDNNTDSGDGCSAACSIETGWLCTGEPSSCSAICGDSMILGTETCDDGGTTPGDGCSASCSIETGWLCGGQPSSCSAICGDGLILGTETCDDSNTNSNDGCSASCSIETGWLCGGEPSSCSAICGDGLIRGPETCDDNNTDPDDGCSASCSIETGWYCDGEPSSCHTTCGDGVTAGIEECDNAGLCTGDDLTSCTSNADCLLVGGTCTLRDGDGCDSLCHIEMCGNGYVQTGAGEECDDSGLCTGDYSTACSSNVDCLSAGGICVSCTSTSGEAACTPVDSDGCDSSCMIETEWVEWVCNGEPSCCSLCGDSITECSETCDNGKHCSNGDSCNVDGDCIGGDGLCLPRSGDGCSATCRIEAYGHSVPLPEYIMIQKITAHPEQRSGPVGTNYDTQFYFSVLTPGQSRDVLFQYPDLLSLSTAGTNTASTALPSGLGAGVYNVAIKAKAHLTRMLHDIYLQIGDNLLNFTNETNSPQDGSVVLIAGDINGAGNSPNTLGDDVINAIDLSILLSNFGTSDPLGSTVRANLNQDSIVDETDLNILLGNLDKEGDL